MFLAVCPAYVIPELLLPFSFYWCCDVEFYKMLLRHCSEPITGIKRFVLQSRRLFKLKKKRRQTLYAIQHRVCTVCVGRSPCASRFEQTSRLLLHSSVGVILGLIRFFLQPPLLSSRAWGWLERHTRYRRGMMVYVIRRVGTVLVKWPFLYLAACDARQLSLTTDSFGFIYPATTAFSSIYTSYLSGEINEKKKSTKFKRHSIAPVPLHRSGNRRGRCRPLERERGCIALSHSVFYTRMPRWQAICVLNVTCSSEPASLFKSRFPKREPRGCSLVVACRESEPTHTHTHKHLRSYSVESYLQPLHHCYCVIVNVDSPFGQLLRWYRLVDLFLDSKVPTVTCTTY